MDFVGQVIRSSYKLSALENMVTLLINDLPGANLQSNQPTTVQDPEVIKHKERNMSQIVVLQTVIEYKRKYGKAHGQRSGNSHHDRHDGKGNVNEYLEQRLRSSTSNESEQQTRVIRTPPSNIVEYDENLPSDAGLLASNVFDYDMSDSNDSEVDIRTNIGNKPTLPNTMEPSADDRPTAPMEMVIIVERSSSAETANEISSKGTDNHHMPSNEESTAIQSNSTIRLPLELGIRTKTVMFIDHPGKLSLVTQPVEQQANQF